MPVDPQDHGGLDLALADIRERFGDSSNAYGQAPEAEETYIGKRAWSRSIRDHNDMPVGGLVVEVGIGEDGPFVLTMEQTGKKGPESYRIRRLPVSDLIIPLEPLTTNQMVSAVRWLGGCIRERGKATDYRPDEELWRWIGNLFEAVKA